MSAPHSTWLEISLSAIQNNVRQMAAITRCPVMAVIKANAYGHGLVEVARAVQTDHASWLANSWLGVARVNEAVILRHAGIRLPILVLGYCPPERAPEAAAQDICLTVYDLELSRAMAAHVREAGLRLRVHVKVDTGMGRLGAFPQDALQLVTALHALPELQMEGVFTHFASADEPQLSTTSDQLNRFQQTLIAIQDAGLRPALVHAANSAAALYFPEARFDMVRAGIAIYGLHPSEEAPLPEGFLPALQWKARLASVKMICPGEGIGYGHRYHTQGQERIGVVPVGYADGMRRMVGVNVALVGGKQVRMVGGICMDQCMLQLDDVPDAQIGDEVTLIGRQGMTTLAAEDLARAWSTVNYEVVCGLAERLARIYV